MAQQSCLAYARRRLRSNSNSTSLLNGSAGVQYTLNNDVKCATWTARTVCTVRTAVCGINSPHRTMEYLSNNRVGELLLRQNVSVLHTLYLSHFCFVGRDHFEN